MLAEWRARSETDAPCERRTRARAASSASLVVMAPPSPVVMDLRGWKLKQVTGLIAPTGRPRYVAPSAGRGVLDHRQVVALGDLQHGVQIGRQADLVHRDDRLGARCDRRLDLALDRCCRCAGRCRRRPACTGVQHRVGGGDEGERGQITSSPGPTPEQSSARCSEVVQLLVATTCATPSRSAIASLEARHQRPLRDPAGANGLGRGLCFFLAKIRLGDRDERGAAALRCCDARSTALAHAGTLSVVLQRLERAPLHEFRRVPRAGPRVETKPSSRAPAPSSRGGGAPD